MVRMQTFMSVFVKVFYPLGFTATLFLLFIIQCQIYSICIVILTLAGYQKDRDDIPEAAAVAVAGVVAEAVAASAAASVCWISVLGLQGWGAAGLG